MIGPIPSIGSLREAPPALRETVSLPTTVSIVITTYNHARFLGEAIESALGQTVRPGELIVVDDGSTDGPDSVVSRYPGVRLIRQLNQGLAAARNTGWRAASGHYVVFLDADDRLMPEALACNLQRFAKKLDCAFVYGGYCYIDLEGRHLSTPPLNSVGDDAYETFLNGNCVAMHATVMYRRECLEEVGGFDARLPCCEDYELYLRLARRYRAVGGTERIAEYRRHDSNMSRNIPLMLDTALAVLRGQARYLDGNPQWRRAFRTGIRNWKSIYAEAQVYNISRIGKAQGLIRVPWRESAKVFAIAPAAFFRFACRRGITMLRPRLARLRRRPISFGD